MATTKFFKAEIVVAKNKTLDDAYGYATASEMFGAIFFNQRNDFVAEREWHIIHGSGSPVGSYTSVPNCSFYFAYDGSAGSLLWYKVGTPGLTNGTWTNVNS